MTALAVNFDRPLRNGIDGLRDTIRAMCALVCSDTRSEVVAALAKDFRSDRIHVTLQRTFSFVVDTIRYELDPDDIELVRTSERTLRDGRGDCDDFAVLLASLLRANAIPVRFAVVRTPGHTFFNHVFLEASTDDGATWLALDGTLPGAKLGKRPPVILGALNFNFRCPQ